MGIRVISTKVAAILLGPAGIGLIGIFQTITNLGTQLSGLGINQSGVRDVAASVGSGKKQRIAQTVSVVRKMCWLTGLTGAAALALLAAPVSGMTFGSSEHALELALLSLAILITTIAQGQMAVIQGLRRLGDLVRVQIFGALAGTAISISLYATLGLSGIVPALIACALCDLGASWWYSRKIFPQTLSMSWKETFSRAKSLVGLGTAFMIGAVACTATNYAARALIAHQMDIHALGMYQAAFGISAYVVTFITGAMGADFYPRLAEASKDHPAMTKMVNEQIEIGLLLAAPAFMAVLTFAPLIITLLYSSDFTPAIQLLRWLVIGCFLRVISWPLGFVQRATGAKKCFIAAELSMNAVHLVFILTGISLLGLKGTAMAFFAMNVIHTLCMYFIARHLIRFTWSQAALHLITVQISLVTLVFLTHFVMDTLVYMVFGAILSMFSGVYSLRQLFFRLGKKHRVCRMVQKILGNRLWSLLIFKR